MSHLELKEMQFCACHGVTAQERKVGNTYMVDLNIYFDFTRATQTDELSDTISYATIYELIAREMAIPSHLIEHVAGRILRQIHLAFPQIDRLEIRLAKQNPLGGDLKEAAVFLRSNRRV
ncbi:dihydroneopterin aldolase [Candidatus Symbiothrix dinenymphae]|nr:dihydroneopterin aldolase [Candidatus Symbiothrix dinenymphae]